MAEETNDASRTIPLVVVSAVVANAAMLLTVGWTLIFCLGDLGSVLNSATGQPVIQIFYNATGSVAGTCVMVAVVLVIFLSACIGQVATASRQMWSFARDNGEYLDLCLQPRHLRAFSDGLRADRSPAIGLPGSRWLAKVPVTWNIPINAIMLSAIITCLLSLINLGKLMTLPFAGLSCVATDG